MKGKKESRGEREEQSAPKCKLQVARKDSEETRSDSGVMEKQGVMDV